MGLSCTSVFRLLKLHPLSLIDSWPGRQVAPEMYVNCVEELRRRSQSDTSPAAALHLYSAHTHLSGVCCLTFEVRSERACVCVCVVLTVSVTKQKSRTCQGLFFITRSPVVSFLSYPPVSLSVSLCCLPSCEYQ